MATSHLLRAYALIGAAGPAVLFGLPAQSKLAGGKDVERKACCGGMWRKMTGMSRAQITRLIARYEEAGAVKAQGYRRHRFYEQVHASRYRVAGKCG